jgi:HK97 family phage prohead protease
MFYGGADGGGLELRRRDDGGVELGGKFVYGVNAVLSDGGRRGRPKKERIKSRAFRYRVETPSEHGGPKQIHLLAGHDYNRPLASVRAGTLKLVDTAAALLFTAIITRAVAETQHGKDTLNLIDAGLAVGISPGFRLPPERAVPEAETIEDEEYEPEEGKYAAIIRTIIEALLYELSIVTRPAYPETQVELRNWSVSTDTGLVVPRRIQRWRA